jgi:hypothetical protein
MIMEDTWWELWCQSILLAVAHHKNTTNYYCLISRKKHTFVELDENCFALILFFIQPHYFYRQENCRVWPVLFWVIKKGVSSLLDEELKSHQTAQSNQKKSTRKCSKCDQEWEFVFSVRCRATHPLNEWSVIK